MAMLVMTAVGVVATVGGSWITWLVRRDKKQAGRSSVGRRRHRLGRRTPLTQMAAPIDPPAAWSLAESIGVHRRVPLQYTRPRFWPRALWSWFRRTYTARETDPKSGFPIESWKYKLGRDLEDEGMFRHGSGFAFEFRLAAGQNGHHLLRSARAQKKAKERMIAIASADEAVNPEAKVRCVLVDAETLRLAGDDPRYAVALSADKPKGGQRRVFRQKNWKIPEDALWLVHPTQPDREPTKEWGQSSEELTCADIGPAAGWSDDLREARRQARRRRLKAIAVHAAVWGYWFAWAVYWGRTSPEGSLDEQIWGASPERCSCWR